MFFPNGIDESSPDFSLWRMTNSLVVQGIGMATTTLQTHSSVLICLLILHSLYVLQLPCNLLSPQWLITTYKNNIKSSFHIFPNGCILLINHHVIPLQYHPQSNLSVFKISTPSNHLTIFSPPSNTSHNFLVQNLCILNIIFCCFAVASHVTQLLQCNLQYCCWQIQTEIWLEKYHVRNLVAHVSHNMTYMVPDIVMLLLLCFHFTDKGGNWRVTKCYNSLIDSHCFRDIFHG